MSLGFGTPVLLHTFFLFWAAAFFCESLKSFKQISSCSSRYQMSCHVHSGFFIPRNLVVYISSCQLRCTLWITLSFSSFASMAGFVSALLCTHFSTCFQSSGWGSSFLRLRLLGGMGGTMKGCGRMEPGKDNCIATSNCTVADGIYRMISPSLEYSCEMSLELV